MNSPGTGPPTHGLVPDVMIWSTLILSAIGVVGNGIIVLATMVSPQLQHRCGFLIATLAFVDFVICGYLVQLRVMQFQDIYLISNQACFFHSIHGILGLNIQSFLGLSIGIDRLLAVVIPLRYGRLPLSLHISLVGAAVVYGIILTGIGAIDASRTAIVPVCMPPTAYNATSRMIWIAASFALAILILGVYCVAHYKCAQMGRTVAKTNRASYLRLRRLLSSLTIVVVVYASTWFLTVCALLVTQVFARDTPLARGVEQQLAWLVILNASLDFFIYLWRAPEYRRAFIGLLGPLCSQNRGREVVSVASTELRTTTLSRAW